MESYITKVKTCGPLFECICILIILGNVYSCYKVTKYVIDILGNLFNMIFNQSFLNICARLLSDSVAPSKLVLGCGSNFL